MASHDQDTPAAVLNGVIVSLLLIVLAVFAADVTLTLLRWGLLLLLAVLGVLPPAVSKLAPLWSGWQLAQIAEAVFGSPTVAAVPAHALSLAAIAAACFAAVRRTFGRPR
jgi:hypothetical protein